MRALSWLVRFAAIIAAASMALAAGAQRSRDASPPVREEIRVALVIGNGAYANAPLANPANDAADVAAALKAAGFRVTLGTNMNQREMRQAIRDFGTELRRAQVGLFFFAGHGVQVRGNNYLVPVGVEIGSEADAEDLTVDANFTLRTMEDSQVPVSIAILDACRNNPFSRGFRSAARGLAVMNATTGSLIAFATAPGSVASDGGGRNGTYTKHLLASLLESDTDIMKVFQRARAGVVKETGGKQIPWESTSLVGDFHFRPPAGNAPALAPSQTPVAAGPDSTLDRAFWDSVKDSKNPAEFKAYLEQFPQGQFAGLARVRMSAVAPAQIASAAPASAASGGTPSRGPGAVVMKTSLGEIEIALFEDKAPKSVANFLQYVQSGFYEGLIFHRVIDNFMIQGGGYKADMQLKTPRAPIESESHNRIKNEAGTVVMARTSSPNSATSQFFINLKDNPFLDYSGQEGSGYTVFGKVVRGMDVVKRIGGVATAAFGPHQNMPAQPVTIESVRAAR